MSTQDTSPTPAEYTLYESQLNFIEDMLSSHPESIEIFNPEERALFLAYFVPDWDQVDDYREYYRELISNNPSIQPSALSLLKRYLEAHRVEDLERLLFSN